MSRGKILLIVVLLVAVGVGIWWYTSREKCDVQSANLAPRTQTDKGTPIPSDVSYLAAIRQAVEAENPAMKEQWQKDQAEYAAFKQTRIAEMKTHPYYNLYPYWSEDEWIGWDTWINWTGGNAFMWRDLSERSAGKLNLLKLLDNNLIDRIERFDRFGLINSPAASAPARDANGDCIVDAYGLCLDQVEDWQESEQTRRFMGRDASVMGMRIFPNPGFDPAAWDSSDPWGQEGFVEPPYLVGITCGFCHISFNPVSPPADKNNPEWENLSGALGNIYLKEGPLFSWVLDFGEESFNTHYLEAQPPGTSDTSRIASDDVDNPNAINAIFNLPARLGEAVPETMPNGFVENVPHILKDGADSVGVPLASVRVYVNIGLLGNYWLKQHDIYLLVASDPPRPQQPFRIDVAMQTPNYDGRYSWNETEVRMADAKTYLSSIGPYKLADAPGGAAHLTAADDVLARGRRVFADHCARCHSSKQPAIDREADPAGWQQAMRELAAKPDFLDGNFLSDDQRHPVTEVGVNMARCMGTNAAQGHIWEDFSSLTYKNQPSLGTLELPHYRDGEKPIRFCAPYGGRGYYRTASLVSIWATAPFFHNNSIGLHEQDPSLDGRLKSFKSATEQLLWPAKRTDPAGSVGRYIKRTPACPLKAGCQDDDDRFTWLSMPNGLTVPIPPETPIKLLGNIPLHSLAEKLPAPLRERLLEPGAGQPEWKEKIAADIIKEDNAVRRLLVKVLLELNTAPDFVENKGHEAMVAELEAASGGEADGDKRALVEFMRTF